MTRQGHFCRGKNTCQGIHLHIWATVMKSPKLLARTHRAAHNMLICLQSHSSTHFLPRLDWATKRDGVCVCVCVIAHARAGVELRGRGLRFQMNVPGSGIPLSAQDTHKQTHTHTQSPFIHSLFPLANNKAHNLHCMQRTPTHTHTHTVFKRIFPFAQQTNSYIFSHLMPPLLVDRWALENCCCLSEWDCSLSLSKWFI